MDAHSGFPVHYNNSKKKKKPSLLFNASVFWNMSIYSIITRVLMARKYTVKISYWPMPNFISIFTLLYLFVLLLVVRQIILIFFILQYSFSTRTVPKQ